MPLSANVCKQTYDLESPALLLADQSNFSTDKGESVSMSGPNVNRSDAQSTSKIQNRAAAPESALLSLMRLSGSKNSRRSQGSKSDGESQMLSARRRREEKEKEQGVPQARELTETANKDYSQSVAGNVSRKSASVEQTKHGEDPNERNGKSVDTEKKDGAGQSHSQSPGPSQSQTQSQSQSQSHSRSGTVSVAGSITNGTVSGAQTRTPTWNSIIEPFVTNRTIRTLKLRISLVYKGI